MSPPELEVEAGRLEVLTCLHFPPRFLNNTLAFIVVSSDAFSALYPAWSVNSVSQIMSFLYLNTLQLHSCCARNEVQVLHRGQWGLTHLAPASSATSFEKRGSAGTFHFLSNRIGIHKWCRAEE